MAAKSLSYGNMRGNMAAESASYGKLKGRTEAESASLSKLLQNARKSMDLAAKRSRGKGQDGIGPTRPGGGCVARIVRFAEAGTDSVFCKISDFCLLLPHG